MPRFFRRRFPAAAAAVSAAMLLLGTLLPPSPAAAQTLPEADPVPARQAAPGGPADRFVVKFRDSAKRSSAERDRAYDNAAARVGAAAEEVRTTAAGARVVETGRELSPGEAADLVRALEARSDVEYAEPDILLRPAADPDDTFYGLQWGLSADRPGMRLSEAWGVSTGAGRTVAVIDTGITAHSDLNANVLPGYDMITDAAMARDGGGRDANPQDEGDWCQAEPSSWHGTHVAGIVAAIANNGQGVAGVAYNAKLLPVRALGACGGYLSDAADAVIWAAGGTVPGAAANANPADVINMSLGAETSCPDLMQKAVDYAVARGTAVVAAAGNENLPAEKFAPANCANVITVAAAGPGGDRAPYSNYGASVDLTAPGGDMSHPGGGIASTVNEGSTAPGAEGYAYMQGTSMAAPHVAGLAALMLSANPGLSPAQVEERMKATARPAASCSQGCGSGLVDAAAALDAVAAPVVAGTPAIGGQAAVGSVLRADPGSWDPALVTLSYQWHRGGVAIPGATAPTYTPVPEDLGAVLSVTVTGAKDGHVPASATAAAAPVSAGTLSTAAPAVSGTAKVGSTLTAVPGTWTRGTVLKYQWYRSGTAIPGATGSTYRLTAADEGRNIKVRATGTLAGYTPAARYSAATAAVAKGTLTAPTPRISGTAKVGSTLTANAGTWTDGTRLTYQWYRSGTAIKGATARTYKVVSADRGDTLKVRVTGSKAGYTTVRRYSAGTPRI